MQAVLALDGILPLKLDFLVGRTQKNMFRVFVLKNNIFGVMEHLFMLRMFERKNMLRLSVFVYHNNKSIMLYDLLMANVNIVYIF